VVIAVTSVCANLSRNVALNLRLLIADLEQGGGVVSITVSFRSALYHSLFVALRTESQLLLSFQSHRESPG